MRISLTSPVLVAVVLCGCVEHDRTVATSTPKTVAIADGISLGMTRAEALQRLVQSGASEVPKDVFPDAKGWSVVGGHECLYLSFTNDVLAGIQVELNADQPKMYRHWYETNSFRLH
jgi:hypothetical protein